jgi:hypothetical protein
MNFDTERSNDAAGDPNERQERSHSNEVQLPPEIPVADIDESLDAGDDHLPIDRVQQAESVSDVPEVPVAKVANERVADVGSKIYSDDLPTQFQNISAKGGAVAAVTLGLLTIFGAFITQWSMFNGIIGLPLGLWGLSSPLKRTTWAGIFLCVVGLALCALLNVGR